MASMRRALGNSAVARVRDEDGDETRIAARADGGEVEPGSPVLVGERGPEAVVPLTPEQEAAKEQAIAEMRARMQKEHEDFEKEKSAQVVGRAATAERERPQFLHNTPEGQNSTKNIVRPFVYAAMPVATLANKLRQTGDASPPSLTPLSNFLAALGRGRR
jgi:SLT domain-containing protein